MPLTEYWSWIANLPHFSTTSLTADVQCDSAMATPYPLSVASKLSSKPGARRVSVSSHPSTHMAPLSPAHDCLSPQAQNRLPFPMRDCLGQQTRGKPCANTASRARMQVYTAVLHTQCARCCSCNEQSRCSKGPHQHCQCGNYLPDLERGVHRTWCDTCQVTAQTRQGTVGHRSRGRSLSRRRIGAHNP